MNLQLGGIQKTALLALAMRADETSRPAPRIHDQRAQEILRTLGVSFEDVARELGICVSTSVPPDTGVCQYLRPPDTCELPRSGYRMGALCIKENRPDALSDLRKFGGRYKI